MTTNFFFNNYRQSQEQLVLEDLIVEAIRIYGEDMYYVPRVLTNLDKLYTEDDQSRYEQAFLVELYIKSVDGFSGDGNFMSKFGLEIRDQVIFSIAQRTFNKEIGAYTTLVRPREGDLIYFPLNNKCFQIKYVNKFEMFYQLGALQTWEITCELFEYADEVFDTRGDRVPPKTMEDSISSFLSMMQKDMRDKLENLSDYKDATSERAKSLARDNFEKDFMKKYHLNARTGKPLTAEEIKELDK